MPVNRELSEKKVEEAREKVRQWGTGISRGQWDWHALGHTLQCAHEAIESDPQYQRPWTILADIYHRIGKKDLAKECLRKSYSLATPGPRFPGGFYKEVQGNISSGYPFNRAGGVRRESPPSWFEEKYQRYWTIGEATKKPWWRFW